MSNKTNRSAKTIHVEYTRAYHETLKYEEVLNIDLDRIYQTYLKVLAEMRATKDLSRAPHQSDIDRIVDAILDKIGV